LGIIAISRGCFERCCSNQKTPQYHSNLGFVTLRNRRPTLLHASAYRTRPRLAFGDPRRRCGHASRFLPLSFWFRQSQIQPNQSHLIVVSAPRPECERCPVRLSNSQAVSLIQRVLITLVLQLIVKNGFSFDSSIACSEFLVLPGFMGKSLVIAD